MCICYKMPDYKITQYSLDRAKELNVELKPANNKHKKIGIWKDGVHLTDIGAKNFLDYPSYLALEKAGEYPKWYASDRRRLYHIRHKYDKGPAGFYSGRILW